MTKEEAIAEGAKRAKLQDLLARMHPQDRAAFLEAQRKYKPNLDHDLFVASLHVPPRGAGFSDEHKEGGSI